MKIEEHIYKQVCDRGTHTPVTPDLIRYDLPSIEDFRKVVPANISTDDLQWIYLRHVGKGREESPEWRLRLMYYLNNLVKLRSDPQFIESEAIICYLSNGTTKQWRWPVVKELESSVDSDGETTDFVQWYDTKTRFYREGYDGRAIISQDDGGYYPTHFDTGLRFEVKGDCYRYARSCFRKKFMGIVGRAL